MPRCSTILRFSYVVVLTQLFDVVVLLGALAVYIWRQRYQTAKYQGMLYQRVHGRRARRSAAST